MEKEMETLYIEGVATHDGPESCVDDPQGRGEALTGGRVGRAISRRIRDLRGADPVEAAEGTNLILGLRPTSVAPSGQLHPPDWRRDLIRRTHHRHRSPACTNTLWSRSGTRSLRSVPRAADQ